MNPPVYKIAQAKNNITVWHSYRNMSSEEIVCRNRATTPAALRDYFARRITRQIFSARNFTVTMLQHQGVKNYQEDRALSFEVPFSDKLTLAEIVEILRKSLQELAQKINMGQSSQQILSSGSTFSGAFIFDGHLITVQLGDSAIFVQQAGSCIPLVNMHDLFNPDEKERALVHMLSKNYQGDVKPLLHEMIAFAEPIKFEFKRYYNTSEALENIFVGYFGQRHLMCSQQNETKSRAAEAIVSKLLNTRSSVQSLLKRIDRFLAHKPPQIVQNQLQALYTFFTDCSVVILPETGGFDEMNPTRGLGDVLHYNEGALSIEPEITVYELPSHQPCLIFVTSDGITEPLKPTDIEEIAKNYTRQNAIPENSIANFSAELLYQSYVRDFNNCDNLSTNAIYLSGQPLSESGKPAKAYFVLTLDGHGNSKNADHPKHAVNVAQSIFPMILQQNFQDAILKKMCSEAQSQHQASASPSLLGFSDLPFFASHYFDEDNFVKPGAKTFFKI